MITNTISPNSFDYDIEQLSTYLDMSNKLVCTFSTEETLEETLSTIQDRYKIIYNKIFILYAKSQEEFVITYNVDLDNISNFIPNTVLVHRKKESNTLYTINSLNRLIESLNGGTLDKNFKINWPDYANCILLTKGPELKRVNTKLYRIVEL